jgi:hypothetical protein
LIISSTNSPSSDELFAQICSDNSLKLNPKHLGFAPPELWPDRLVTFGHVVADFFQRKNSSTNRFSHKLYNALKIADSDLFYVDFVGIQWITDWILKVDKAVFARLLGIKTVDGSLFHQQGNFPSHGFVELSQAEAAESVPQAILDTVDYNAVRLLRHRSGALTRHSAELAIDSCKWTSVRRRSIPDKL